MSKKANQFADVGSMFNTATTTKQETKDATKASTAKSNTAKKLNNHSIKTTKKAVESRSQRKQFLFTPTTATNLKVLAMQKKMSSNEIVNQAVEAYIEKEFKKNPELKEVASTLLKLEK